MAGSLPVSAELVRLRRELDRMAEQRAAWTDDDRRRYQELTDLELRLLGRGDSAPA